jgi:hypothetical protein
MTMLIIGALLVLGSIGLLYARGRAKDKLLEIRSTSSGSTKDLIELQQSIAGEIGAGGLAQIAELRGAARCEEPLKAELSGELCVYYSCSVQERYEEQYTETDSQGRVERRTRTGSTQVSGNVQSVRFLVDDGAGTVAVDPAGASIDGRKVVDRYEPAGAGGSAIRIGSFTLSIGSSSPGRRILGYQFTETIVPVGATVYVIGEATDKDGTLRIRRPAEKAKPFIISMRSKEEITASRQRGITWMLVGAVAAALGGAALLVAGILTLGS